MPCHDCETLRETHPGALCGSCAGIVPTYQAVIERGDAENAALQAQVEEQRGQMGQMAKDWDDERKRAEQAEAKLARVVVALEDQQAPPITRIGAALAAARKSE